MPKDKVLIISKPLNHKGGVTNYYNLFFKKFNSEVIQLKHHAIGSRTCLYYYPIIKKILYPIYYIFDVFKYIFLLIFNDKIKIIQVSPSLIPLPLIRDGILVIFAKLLGKKVIVFYRGWKLPTLHSIKSKPLLKKIFNNVFQRHTQQVVLANAFKNDLEELYDKQTNTIVVTTTAIDKDEIIYSDKSFVYKDKINVLFLGRIQDYKGIQELIKSIIIIYNLNLLDKFKFIIAGYEGKKGYIEKLKEILNNNNIPSKLISFPGKMVGIEKFKLYASSDVYVLPSYTEGCPNSALEALSSGLFSITTNVGALNDIINEVNGILVNVKDEQQIVDALKYVLKNIHVLKNRKNISESSILKFDITQITKNFDKLYQKLLDN